MPSRTGSGGVAKGGTYKPHSPATARPRPKPASQGHPSRGGTTVGGGTKTKPRVYKSPPAPPKVSPTPHQQLKRSGELDKKGRQKNAGPPRKAREKNRIVRTSKGTKLIPLPKYRRMVRKQKRELAARKRLYAGSQYADDKLSPRDKRLAPVKVAGFSVDAAVADLDRRVFPKGNPGLNLAKMPVQVARATVEDPGGVAKGTGKALKETIVNIPSAAVQTVKDPEKALKQIGADYKRRYGPLLEGDTKKFRERLKKEGALSELADVAGVAGTGSRVAAAAGKVTKRKVMRDRPDQVAPGTTIRNRRPARRGLLSQVARKGVDRHKLARAQSKYRKADVEDATGNVDRARELRAAGARKDPRRVSEREVRRRYDEREDLAERRRRENRTKVLRDADTALSGRKHGKRTKRLVRRTRSKNEATAGLLVAQRVVKPDRKSVASYLEDVKREATGDLTKAQKSANRRLQRRLTNILDDKKLDYSKLQKIADDYAEVTAPLQKELVARGVLDPNQEQMAKLIPYAVREMGAKWNPEAKRLEKQGRSVKAREIEAHMRQNGVDPEKVAFVSQAPKVKGPGSYYKSFQRPQGVGSQRRTGEATRKGTMDVDAEVGRANAASMQGLRDAHNEYSEFVKEFGYRAGSDKVQTFKTGKEADRAIADMASQSPEQGGKLTASTYGWRAVPLNPPFGKKSQADTLLDQANDLTADGRSTSSVEAVESALKGEGSGDYALVLDDAADQMGKHMRQLNPAPAAAAMRQVGRQFSSTVLTTSTTWPAGNIIEGLTRAGVAKAGPADVLFYRQVHKRLEKLDPAMAAELEHRMSQGHFGLADMRAIHTTTDSFKGSPTLQGVARALGTVRRTPGAKQVADVWTAYTRTVFGLNGLLEKQIKTAMAGQAMRELLATEGQLRHWKRSVEQAAQGLKNTNDQVQVARWVRRAYGKYEAFSPSERFIVTNFTPFAMWAINATKFLSATLPKDHPVLSAVLVSNTKAWEGWRKDEALNLAPGYMQGAIPTGDGKGLMRVARYTPFGLAGDPLGTSGGLLLPQFSGALSAMKGLDWKGEPLADKERVSDVTDGERISGAMEALAGSFMPGLAPRKKVKDKGVKGALNPFEPSPRQPPGITKAYEGLKQIEAGKDAIKKKHPDVSSSDPTPEYEKLHRRERKLKERIFRLSKGEYGTKYKEPYEPRGGSASASPQDEFQQFLKEDANQDSAQKEFDEYMKSGN